MTQAYWKPYREIALQAAQKLGKTVYEGVYAGLLGPSYETPAEIRYLRTIGADLVGMSTIAEVIAARAHGDQGSGNFLRDQHGGGNSGPADQSSKKYWIPAERVKGISWRC